MRSTNWLASNWKSLLIGIVALAVVTGLVVWTYMRWQQPAPGAQQGGKRGGGDPTRATPVVAVPAKTADVNVYLNSLGTVTPLKTVTVRSRVDGELMRILFREGDVVKQGQLLAEIDPRPYQAALTQVEGMILRDQALLDNARVDLERYRTLVAQDSAPRQQLDTQEALVRQLEGTVTMDQGQVDNARLQVAYSRIASPIPGRLGLRQVDVGNIIRAGDANGLVVITQLQPITAIYTIPQDNLPAVMQLLKTGERVAVDAFDREQKVKLDSGMLLTVDNQIDATTGTVRLKAQFPNDANNLFANQFVNVRMLVDIRRGATTVPSAAIQRGAQGIYVYVVKDDNTVTLRKVQTGPSEGDATVVESGVEPGEKVVIDGTDRLREGAKVEPTTRDPNALKGGDGTRKKGGGRRKGEDKSGGNKSDGDKTGSDKSMPTDAGANDKAAGDKGVSDKADGAREGWKKRNRDRGGDDKGSAGNSDGKADGDKAADGQKEGGRKRGGWKREKASE
jgi:multidrug efflux system membrane fusion protein